MHRLHLQGWLNAKVGAATPNILKSLTGGKILSLTVMHGNGLRLKVM